MDDKYGRIMMLNYDYPLYRPPSEAKSLIFQVTLGCSFNECSFCDMYRSKEYQERPWDEVKMEIDMMAKQLPDTRRIFLADGDALNLDTEYMVKIVKYIWEKFPNLERISCYAMPMNILKKTPEQLQKMYDAGLTMFYLGIESGSDLILKKVTKGAIGATIVKAVNKAKAIGYTMSCMVIFGTWRKDAFQRTHTWNSRSDQRMLTKLCRCFDIIFGKWNKTRISNKIWRRIRSSIR